MGIDDWQEVSRKKHFNTGSHRTKKDDLNRISTSIFVANFPESTSAKELFHHCKQYGHVVDAYIPVKRTKSGKRFGFQRSPLKKGKPSVRENFAQNSRPEVRKVASSNSYVNEVKPNSSSDHCDVDSSPAIVMKEECLNSKDVSYALLGKVKEYSSLSNLKTAISNEGFAELNICYMGALWVLLEFVSTESKEQFQKNVGMGSWFSSLNHASIDFIPDGRIAWVEIEGIHLNFGQGILSNGLQLNGETFWILMIKEVPGWILNLLDESDDEEDGSMEGDINGQDFGSNGDHSDLEAVSETSFEASNGSKKSNSDDPFNIYSILNRTHKVHNVKENVENSGLVFPPGFTPPVDQVEVGSIGGNPNNAGPTGSKVHSACSGSFKKSIASGGSFLNVMEEVVKVDQTMGFNMDGCEANLSEIIKSQGADKHQLWDYLGHSIDRWQGEVVVMGDFNEVRHRSDRFGSVFNVQGADDFNSFIATVGLVEVPLALTLDRFLSDHRPILLRKVSYDYGPTPFRFFQHWLELDGFNSFVTSQWNKAPVDSAIGLRNLMGKLKFIKSCIKEWLKCNTHCNRGAMEKYKEDLRLIDSDIDSGKGSDMLVAKRIEIRNDLHNIEKLHAMDLAQKAKIKWSIKGDENSRFFHGFDKPPDQRATVDMSFLNFLSPEQQADLECDVTAEELKQAVWDCGLEKSHGLDGFSFRFYRQFWETIEKDVFKAINHFFMHADIPKGDIVSDAQSAFIKGRQILDGPFILNEVMQWCKHKKKQALIFKVDFEKAFDSVRWDFLDDVLRKFGFGNKWCEWIQKFLMSSRGSILINGSPTEEFQFFKGLKQSDPLFPFLFILVMECLHISFQKVVDAGMFTGINLNQSVNLSHLFYADDAVFVGTKVGGYMSRAETWKEVVDKVSSLLSKWKMNALSIGGRLTLLKSVLGSIPIFHVSIFRVPSSVLHKLESIRRNFFNGHDYDSR
nr:RNA-directed DNA polymerase, eukaryota, reverse transcriptase zinc-binding domain protein [Tanacetum cinerariifolium]